MRPESRPKPSKFPSRFISLACRCLLVEGKISRGTFAEYLEIDWAEIDEYLVEAGFMEQNYENLYHMDESHIFHKAAPMYLF